MTDHPLRRMLVFGHIHSDNVLELAAVVRLKADTVRVSAGFDRSLEPFYNATRSIQDGPQR